MNDTKLDTYITNIKSGTTTQKKMLNYKKANRRIEMLQNEYTELCGVLKQVNKKKKKSNDYDIDTILKELVIIEESLDGEQVDMKETIDKFLQHKRLLTDLELGVLHIKNDIYVVNHDMNFKKIDLTDII